MKTIILFFALISLVGCKPKDKTLELTDSRKQEQPKKEEYLEWSKRINFGEQIVVGNISSNATNIQFDSHYKYVGENDGYVCGKVSWVDTFLQTKKNKYFYVYLSFSGGRVAQNSKPLIFDVSESYPMEKYKMLCSLS